MSDTDSTPATSTPTETATATPTTSSSSSSSSSMNDFTQSWKLPEGIEDHIYSGIIKTGVGLVAGAAVGAVIFRSGKGWRTASMAAGAGIAVGSTVERAMADSKMK